jgi:hypothetical protein
MRETLQLGESTLGKQHPFTLTALANLASTLSDLGEHAESEKVYREACVRGNGGNDPRLHLNVRGLAGALEAQGRFAESRALALRELSTHDAIQPNTSVVVRSLRAQTELNGKNRYGAHVRPHERTVHGPCRGEGRVGETRVPP